jgi:5-methylcytosine-specific restriction endonuclease McrA
MATNSPWHHLYNTREWKQLRLAQLRAEPLCRYCLALGKTTSANVADHKQPHKGNRALFFNPFNLQSLCKTCHDSAKQTLERSGVLPGCDVSGVPLDPLHHWYR